MLRFRLSGPYQVPAPLLFRLQARHVDVVYPEPPRLRLSLGGGWGAAGAVQVEPAVLYAAVPPVELRVVLGHTQAPARDDASRSGWRQAGAFDQLQREGWAQALARSSPAAAVAWGDVAPKDRAEREGWQWAKPADKTGHRLVWQLARILDSGNGLRHRDTDRYGRQWRYVEALPPYRPGTQPLRFSFNGVRYLPARTAPVYFQLGRDLRHRPAQPRDQRTVLRHGTAPVRDAARWLPWGRARPADAYPTGITYPDYDGPVIIIEPPAEPDILETYMIANSVSVVVLPERTPLDATDIKLSLDVDSFAWKFSCTLHGVTSLNLVRPSGSGRKTIEVTINGWVWLILVERYSRSAQFPVERFSVSGASRTQLLAAPYAPRRSAMNAVDINARQAAEDQLYLTGFTLNWDATGIGPPDWTITAGALSYQDQTPMQVIARIAEAVGGIVRPDMAGDGLTVLPRYREAVWWWDESIMDRIIPGELITNIEGEWSPQPAWNSVYVSGTTQGVAVDVRRTGTAGDNPAPDVFDDLITATDAARARGICELSKGGDQEVVPLTIPLMQQGGSAPGLVLPGHLCEVREAASNWWRGKCLGVDIGATGTGASKVSQVLRLERHYTEAA